MTLTFNHDALRPELSITADGAVRVDVWGGTVRDRWTMVRRLSRAVASRLRRRFPHFHVEDQNLEVVVAPVWPADLDDVLEAVDEALRAVGLQ